MSEYKERCPMALDAAGGYYFRHLNAMTGEKLHAKSEIAAELGYRDLIIDELVFTLKAALPLLHTGDELPMDYYTDKPGALGNALRAIKRAEER